jgi:beta-lactamase regulating signal transducer with metallopeptidase domain
MTESLAGLTSVLAHLTWQGTVVALAALLALRLVGPRAGAARYRIAMAALALLTLAPAGTLARRGGWLASTSPGWAAAVPEWIRPAATLDPSPAPIGPSVAEPRNQTGAHPSITGSRIERIWRAAMPWLLLAWLLGVGLCLARLAGGIVRLHALRRRSTVAPAAVTREVALLARRLGITRSTEVRASGDGGIPLTFGALRPVVLLPSRFAGDLRPDQMRLVLAHELAHIARRDYLVNLAQCVLEALLFFHPAVHWLSRTAREEREYCCDDLAATVAGNRREVAQALVALEEAVGTRSARSLAPAATGGSLLRRIERLVATAPPPGRVPTMLSLGVLMIAVPLVVLATPASARIVTEGEPAADGFSVVWSGSVGPGERLRVRNLAGSIRVVPAEGSNATIRARVSGAGLTDLIFQPTVDAEGVTVCALRAAYGRCDAEGSTWFGTRDEMHRATIDLVVALPAGAGITAASFDGDLVLDEVSGDAEARTGSGAIAARIAASPDDRILEFHTGAGEVRVALPPRFGGTLRARLSNGTVEHEMPLTPAGGSSPKDLRARFGPGGNRLHASSGNGSLVLTRGP